jgi:hypothetical protein
LLGQRETRSRIRIQPQAIGFYYQFSKSFAHLTPALPAPEGHAPRVEGIPSSKREYLPSPWPIRGTSFGRARTLAAQSKCLPGRLHAQESDRLAFDPPQASFKLLPIKWSRGLYTLFPSFEAPAAKTPSFGYTGLREFELFAGGFDTLRETSFFGHSCSGNSSFITLSGRFFAQEVYAEA